MRKLPATLQDCIPGDIVILPSGLRVVVTGNNMGKAQSHRFVRPVDEAGKEGELMPQSSSLMIIEVISLYFPLVIDEKKGKKDE